MSGVPVPPASYPSALRRCRVGAALSAAHAQGWAADALFGLAALGECVASLSGGCDAVAATYDLSCAYQRSPGAQALLVALEFSNTAGIFTTATVTLSWRSGATRTFIGPAFGFDGSYAQVLAPQDASQPPRLMCLLDVTGLPTNAIDDLNVHVVSATVTRVRGLHLVEVPLADAAPDLDPANEVGVSPGFAVLDGRLVEGSVASGTGWKRLQSAVAMARGSRRIHMQWSVLDDGAGRAAMPSSVYTGSLATPPGATTLTWSGSANWTAADHPGWYARPRRLYATAATATNVYTFRCLCYAPAGGSVAVIFDNNASFIFTVTAAATPGLQVLSTLAGMPTNLAGPATNRVSVAIEASTASAGSPLQLRSWALVEAEV